LITSTVGVEDLVLARRIGDHRTGFFDERGTRRFHRDAREHRTGAVSYDTGDRGALLGDADGRNQTRRGTAECREQDHSTHNPPH
jgi:hypothetical protein